MDFGVVFFRRRTTRFFAMVGLDHGRSHLRQVVRPAPIAAAFTVTLHSTKDHTGEKNFSLSPILLCGLGEVQRYCERRSNRAKPPTSIQWIPCLGLSNGTASVR